MENFLQRARELSEQMVEDRRFLHQHPELGNDLPITKEYIQKRLTEIGIPWKEICPSGITAEIGGKKPGRTILLRTDMDALPICENSGLPFAAPAGTGHACGHDLHMAMLLGAAQMLKEREDELAGTVKLMFQPGEETFDGAIKMIEAGVLENPRPDCALDMHVFTEYPHGMVGCSPGVMSASCDGFRIVITGKGCHGAQPHKGVDPINVGVHIHMALQALISRETPPSEMAVLTVCQFHAGTTSNIIPEQAELSGTLRTYDREVRKNLTARIPEVVEYTAKAFGGSAYVEWVSKVPAIESDPALSADFMGYVQELGEEGFYCDREAKMTASDDFGYVSEQIPSVFFLIAAGPTDGTECYPNHNPQVVFDEGAMPLGAAIHAQCAFRYLQENA